MKKITILIASIVFALTSTVFADGMIGVKYGNGELEGNASAYNNYSAQSGSKDSEFGAIFAEVNVKESPISLGLEYVPFDADISLDGKSSSVSANVSDYTTLYAVAMHELNEISVYAKLGYSMADIGTIKNNDPSTTSITGASDSLEGIMYGVGVQSKELPGGLVARAEATFTEFDDVSVTTTSNGSNSTKKTADGDLTTLTISLAKSF